MGLAEPGPRRTGQIVGTMANDLTQDHSRSLWWLLNAPQAVGNVTAELVLSKANPDLVDTKLQHMTSLLKPIRTQLQKFKNKQGIPKVLMTADGRSRRGSEQTAAKKK